MRNYLTRKNDFDFGFPNFFDDVFGDFFSPAVFGKKGEMRTDVKDNGNEYELSVDMPGYDKNDINIELKDGYVTISAKREEKQEDDKNFLRRERSFSCSRSFYVGENVTENDIKAKYHNGTLIVSFPKDNQKEIPSKHIEID